jgi:tryptophan synthase alpha chain
LSRIDLTFQKLKNRGKAALIAFNVAGDPDLKTAEPLIFKMVESGADMIELGLPFSDPVMDGPTIQASYQRALKRGFQTKDMFSLIKRLKRISVPLIIMTYFRPIFQYGLEAFVMECKESGVGGVIIPDLPPEEARSWIDEARRMDLDTIFLVNPSSSLERIRLVDKCSRGFIYYVSITGITGISGKLPDNLEQAIKGIKEYTRKPVAVGFGISTPEQAKMVSRFADGVIVGSAIVKIIEENLENPDLVDRVGKFVSSLAKGVRS